MSCTLHRTRVDIALIWKLVAVVVLNNWDKDVPRHSRQRGDLDQIPLQKAYGEFKTFLVKGMCISGKPGSTGSQTHGVLAQLPNVKSYLADKFLMELCLGLLGVLWKRNDFQE